MYCILCCRVSSFQKPCQNERNGDTVQWNSRPWESEDMWVVIQSSGIAVVLTGKVLIGVFSL
ncbi:hypothetical protein SLEP1_g9418 [Rubroshorea leprosula]|uniref:Uncharacterized protein n=1 Tax=Rubroshorea leprosula TaxID=152421 RepID=A0AAV5I9C4_9ROSI|nr:hypothetical protein SLEP1_g9418 [Rubroshorea leprosula]